MIKIYNSSLMNLKEEELQEIYKKYHSTLISDNINILEIFLIGCFFICI